MTNLVELIVFGGTALAMALVAGVFLAFSDFVMRALGLARGVAGIKAMQVINREVYGSAFLVALLGLAPVAVALGLYALARVEGAAMVWIVAGAALYVIGTVLVTMLGNVPMNKRLDMMMTDAPDTLIYWRHYVRRWTMFNHLRTAASVLAAGAFVVGTTLLV
ncbi:anthrone oxygenase family protein [uncultured Roseovarius sp.]|uniref:anthrone oxygenase family protein n=1 Tax=uncultured Roseovarius sp. TaxID=293344 RepID=UPI0026303E60|nr:anthrone oxygenase family protein [uncultured Roseovarius sp.]